MHILPFALKFRCLQKQKTECSQYYKENKVVYCECKYIISFMGIVRSTIAAKRYDACQGCNQRSKPSDIDAVQKRKVIGCEARQKYCSRYVAYNLRKANAEKHFTS